MIEQIFAHRGASAGFPEHTRAAYLQALADGADGVEGDLHLTADGALVLIHDDTLDRTSNGSGPVGAHTLEELCGLDFTSWKGARIPPEYGRVGEQLLTLDGLLDILAGAGREMALALEFKYGELFDPALVDAALEALGARGWSAARSMAGKVQVSFMSFHPEAVKYLSGHVPAAMLCQLLQYAETGAGRELLANGEALLDDGAAHLAGPGVAYLRANPGNAARWLAAGRTLRVWTVDTAEDLQLCLDAGVAEVTTNRPAAIRAMLGRAPSAGGRRPA
ncbi:glycerophosphodiester phosphodiesterase [Arthrobacter dokdonensis]|uniref:glycerophosphodiester phosphodiesterase n=1 Tax=Arthrobacter dokdonellae TaxID=2211210 RepID=UPI000DE5C482|nr:glycerophosphodiester phosphodiesterase family protein [Arthrobacter dokdonellae]